MVKNQISIFVVGTGGFGGPRNSDAVIATVKPPNRQPDKSLCYKTTIDQVKTWDYSQLMHASLMLFICTSFRPPCIDWAETRIHSTWIPVLLNSPDLKNQFFMVFVPRASPPGWSRELMAMAIRPRLGQSRPALPNLCSLVKPSGKVDFLELSKNIIKNLL